MEQIEQLKTMRAAALERLAKNPDYKLVNSLDALIVDLESAFGPIEEVAPLDETAVVEEPLAAEETVEAESETQSEEPTQEDTSESVVETTVEADLEPVQETAELANGDPVEAKAAEVDDTVEPTTTIGEEENASDIDVISEGPTIGEEFPDLVEEPTMEENLEDALSDMIASDGDDIRGETVDAGITPATKATLDTTADTNEASPVADAEETLADALSEALAANETGEAGEGLDTFPAGGTKLGPTNGSGIPSA